jgi:hypothetical protein
MKPLFGVCLERNVLFLFVYISEEIVASVIIIKMFGVFLEYDTGISISLYSFLPIDIYSAFYSSLFTYQKKIHIGVIICHKIKYLFSVLLDKGFFITLLANMANSAGQFSHPLGNGRIQELLRMTNI